MFHHTINPGLDHINRWHEMTLHGVDGSHAELCIRQFFSSFHDAHDGGVEIMFTVALDGSLRAFGLLRLLLFQGKDTTVTKRPLEVLVKTRTHRYFSLYRVDMQLRPRVGEPVIELEDVCGVYIPTNGDLLQHFLFATRETLKSPLKLSFVCGGMINMRGL